MEKMVNKNFWKGKKILITGHTGFKGSWLTLILKKLNCNVYGLSLPNPKKYSFFNQANISDCVIKNYFSDICKFNSLKKIVSEIKPDIIFHLAAQSLVIDSYKNPLNTFNTNIMGTANLLKLVSDYKLAQVFINVTSDKCYKNSQIKNKYFKEDDPLGGDDPYSASKACAELISHSMKSYFQNNGIGLCNVRAGNVIGGGDWAKNRIIPDLYRSYQQNQSLELRYPYATRPWQHVFDPLHGYLILAEQTFYNAKKYSGSWNFGPSRKKHLTVLDLVQSFTDKIDEKIKIKVNKNNSAKKESTYLALNSTKSKLLLNWKPRLSINKTIDLTSSWYIESLNKKGNIRIFSEKQITEFFGI